MNQKGFTLVELLATLLIIGIVMGITIPNVTGIFSQGKTTTYAEDAKKMKSTAEYMLRSNNSVIKPSTNGECVVVSLKYLDEADEFKPPYGGEYLDNKSFVVMKLHNRRYYYYVQLIEKIPNSGGYRGFKVVDVTLLDEGNYFAELDELTSESSLVNLSSYVSNPNSLLSHSNISGLGCSTMLKVYTS